MTCRQGHDAPRRKNGNCIECERLRSKRRWVEDQDALKAKNAAWREANKDHVRAKCRDWHAKNREYANATCRAWYAKNAEKARSDAAAWRAANPERRQAMLRTWYVKNREAALESARARVKAEPEKIRANRHKRRARLLQAPGGHTAADIREIGRLQRARCAYCRISIRGGYHLDHIMPLKLGGSNDRANLQLLCAPCNHRKSAKHPIRFAQEIGRLL